MFKSSRFSRFVVVGGVVFALTVVSILLKSGNANDHSIDPFHVETKTSFTESLGMYAYLMKSFNAENTAKILNSQREYRSKAPFPHTFIDSLVPMEIMRKASNEIPDDPTTTADGCVIGNSNCFIKDKTQNFKNAFTKEIYFGPATFTLFSFLKSSTFINFLENLTGISDLIPDPHYRGSGVHQTLSGGHLDIHADFNRYERYQLHRRVNVFIYLNDEWDDSFGGHLELWSKDMESCGAKIRPTLGRFVVFSSTDFSYHGHPNPLSCPKNRSRRSIALYYYTRTRPANECLKGDCLFAHTTLFQRPKSSCEIPAV